jgi:glucose/arabinose dehydrogenase
MTRHTSRRRFIAALGAAGTAGCVSGPTVDAGAADAQGAGTQEGDTQSDGAQDATAALPDSVGLRPVVSGLEQPIDVAFAPDADRRYVAERAGVIYVHEPDGVQSEPLLDLRDEVVTGGERGLLGIALSPEFAEDRRLFVRYSSPRRPGTPVNYSHTFVLAEFTVSADGRRAQRDSERTILEIAEPKDYHNGGDIAFGTQGNLYVAVGDGGDGSGVQDEATNRLSGILRIDVQQTPSASEDDTDQRYVVPEDNPLVGRGGLDEYYAWGLRNPWRMAFDGEDLYVGDVGESDYEEVNLVERGGNYGWNVKEGTHCFQTDDCPDRTEDGEPFVDPIVEYPHSGDAVSGVSVVGGNVYRGTAVPALEGAYVFGDFQADGRLFAAARPDEDRDGLWPTTVLDVEDGERLGYVLSFARHDGELYVLGVGSAGGGLFRVAEVA